MPTVLSQTMEPEDVADGDEDKDDSDNDSITSDSESEDKDDSDDGGADNDVVMIIKHDIINMSMDKIFSDSVR